MLTLLVFTGIIAVFALVIAIYAANKEQTLNREATHRLDFAYKQALARGTSNYDLNATVGSHGFRIDALEKQLKPAEPAGFLYFTPGNISFTGPPSPTLVDRIKAIEDSLPKGKKSGSKRA
jgi:hypothetical protein